MINLTQEQKEIMMLLGKFGCADTKQIYEIMQPADKDLITILLNRLIKSNHIELINNQYIVRKNESNKFDRETINCIWVMLGLGKEKEDYLEAMVASSPAKIFFTSQRTKGFEIIPVNESRLISLRISQDKIIEKLDKTKSFIQNNSVLVCDNKTYIEKVRECKFEFPFIVADVQYVDGMDQKPIIKFYEKRVKKEIENNEN